MAKDHNIENYFRKKLESQEFVYREADWLSLEQHLEPEGMSTPSGLIMPVSRMVAILLIALSTAFVMGWFAHDWFRNETLSEATQPVAEPSEKVENDKVPVDSDSVHTATATRKIAAGNNTPRGSTHQIRQHDTDTRSSAMEPSKHERTPPGYMDTDASMAANQMEEQLPFSQQSHANERHAQNHIQPIPAEPVITGAVPGLHKQLSRVDQTEERDYYTVQNISSPGRWSVAFSLASDFNSVGLPEKKTGSARIGALVFYNVSPRWHVSAGILYNNKRYNSQGKYYNPPEGYWIRNTGGQIPDEVTGSCRVVDIPVMISYRMMQTNTMAFTVSAGVSNYLMLDEYYDYRFDQRSPDMANGWQTQENTWVPWGIANLALGMDIQTSARTILSVEPFLKIPYKKIGWANLDLHSTGMQIALIYRLNQSSNPK